MLAVSTKSVKQTKNRLAISSDLNWHLFELHWCTKLLQRSMVDGNVFVVRIIILQPQNGIQNKFAPYSAVSVSVLYVNK